METGQIRRWLLGFFGDGSISGIRTWIAAVIAIVRAGIVITVLIRWIRKPVLEAEDVAGSLPPMRLRIVAADAVDQPRLLQCPEMIVQG